MRPQDTHGGEDFGHEVLLADGLRFLLDELADGVAGRGARADLELLSQDDLKQQLDELREGLVQDGERVRRDLREHVHELNGLGLGAAGHALLQHSDHERHEVAEAAQVGLLQELDEAASSAHGAYAHLEVLGVLQRLGVQLLEVIEVRLQRRAHGLAQQLQQLHAHLALVHAGAVGARVNEHHKLGPVAGRHLVQRQSSDERGHRGAHGVHGVLGATLQQHLLGLRLRGGVQLGPVLEDLLAQHERGQLAHLGLGRELQLREQAAHGRDLLGVGLERRLRLLDLLRVRVRELQQTRLQLLRGEVRHSVQSTREGGARTGEIAGMTPGTRTLDPTQS